MATSTERFGFTKPAGSDPASVVPLNSNTDLIELYLGRTQDMIAPLYNDTDTYDIGDIVTYESNLYKCITAISTAETFDPTKWEATTAVDEGGGGGSGASAIEKTQVEYDALTPAQKTNGAIYMVQSEGDEAETAVDMSAGSKYGESDMSFTANANSVVSSWSGGGSIGGDWRFTNPIDVTDISKIKFSIATGTCYGHMSASVEEQTTARFINTMYIFRTMPTGYAIDTESSAIKFLKFSYTNTDYGEQEFDVSELIGEVYLVWASTGWNATLSDIVTSKVGDATNKIYYMGTEYANTNGGSGEEGDGYKLEKIFDGNVTTAGNITLTKSINNYDELIFIMKQSSTYIRTDVIPIEFIKNIASYSTTNGVMIKDYSGYHRYFIVDYVDNTTLNITVIENTNLVEIYGVKHSSGGGGGSSEAEDINYDNTTSQLTADNVQDALDEVVANVGTASEDILTLQNVQGYDKYDETQTYAVGDYAIYNNIVYECTTAVSTAEPFDSTKWTATSIEQIIDGVKGDISQLNSSLTPISIGINNLITTGAFDVPYATANKSGNVITLVALMRGKGQNVSAGTPLATIKSGYRPKQDLYIPVADNNSVSTYLKILTNGNIVSDAAYTTTHKSLLIVTTTYII